MKPTALAGCRPPLGLLAVIAAASALAGPDPSPPAWQAEQPLCPPALATRNLETPALVPAGAQPGAPGYADRLSTTRLGWPRLSHWCVWIEPSPPGPAASDPVQRRWQLAVLAALDGWRGLVPLTLVADPAAAQVRIWHRPPPLRLDGAGRPRASHGRALLRLAAVERREGAWRLEPAVEVLIGPGQRAEALRATVLHELGHAFGMWGHSEEAGDVMATTPGPVPVLMPSERDRSTLRWLYAQPTGFGAPFAPPPLLAVPADR